MKKRILFVDDEAGELQKLQQPLEKMADRWDVLYAHGGLEALELLEQRSCDVVVSDMCMPGMDGAQLLNKVGQAYPVTLRFILASFADKELILKCVSGTHQFVAKPVDPETLISTVQRALALDAWLSNDNIKVLVAKMGNFPSLPSVYLEILKQIESPHASIQSIGEVIVKDIATTAKILQIVNSAFFGLPQKITSAQEALGVLGIDTVKSLVLCVHVFSHFEKLKPSGFSIDHIWNNSLEVARAAQRIALEQTQDRGLGDEAFTAGLLHQIGKVVLACNLPKEYHAALQLARADNAPDWQAEQEVFGASHAETGAYLLGLWGMPVQLLEATALQHSPGQCFNKKFSALTALHVAKAIVGSLHPAEYLATRAPEIDLAYLDELGLKNRVDDWRAAITGASRPGTKAPEMQAPPREVAVTVPSAASAANHESDLAPRWAGGAGPPTKFFDRWFGLALPASAGLMVALGIWLFWPDKNRDSGHPDSVQVHAREATAAPAHEELAPTDHPADATLGPDEKEATAFATTDDWAPPVAHATDAEPVTAPEVVFPTLKLQGIFFRKTNPSVVLSGQTLLKGDKIQGVEVLSIDRQSVKLGFNGQIKTLAIH